MICAHCATHGDFTFIWVSSRFETLSQGELKLHSMEQEACQGYLRQSLTIYHSICTKRRHIYSRHEDKSKSKTNGAQEEEHAAYSAADPLLPQRRQG